MSDTRDKVIWLLIGASVGAGIALLYAPKTGRDTRRLIAKKSGKTAEALADTGRDLLDKGKDLLEKGRRMTEDAQEMIERGRRAMGVGA